MLDKQLGELVAQGRTADIHAWQDDQTVVKLYHDWFLRPWIEGEAERTRALQSLDFPIPKVGELIEVNGRNGLIMERIYGENMLALLKQRPELSANLAQRLAEMQIRMHALTDQPDIPEQHPKLAHKIREATALSDSLKTALLAKLEQMPIGRSVCHGDFHPGNVVVGPDGSGDVAVDWNDCTFGNPLADVARSTILFLGGITGNETPDPDFENLVRTCHAQYLDRYFELRGSGRDEYEQWLPIVAGARLSENITALEPWLLSEAAKINPS